MVGAVAGWIAGMAFVLVIEMASGKPRAPLWFWFWLGATLAIALATVAWLQAVLP